MTTTELMQAFLLSLQTGVLIAFARKWRAARKSDRLTRKAVAEAARDAKRWADAAHAHAGSATHAAGVAMRQARAAGESVDEMKDMGAPLPPDVLPFPGVNPTGRAPWPGEREMAARAGIRLADLGDDQQAEENVAIYRHGAD